MRLFVQDPIVLLPLVFLTGLFDRENAKKPPTASLMLNDYVSIRRLLCRTAEWGTLAEWDIMEAITEEWVILGWVAGVTEALEVTEGGAASDTPVSGMAGRFTAGSATDGLSSVDSD